MKYPPIQVTHLLKWLNRASFHWKLLPVACYFCRLFKNGFCFVFFMSYRTKVCVICKVFAIQHINWWEFFNASICQNSAGRNNPGHIWKFYLTEIIKKLACCIFLVWNRNPYELVEYQIIKRREIRL